MRRSLAEADERASFAGPGWWKETPTYLDASRRRYEAERRLRDEQIVAEEDAIVREFYRLRVSRPDEKIVVDDDGIVRMASTMTLVFGYAKACSRKL